MKRVAEKVIVVCVAAAGLAPSVFSQPADRPGSTSPAFRFQQRVEPFLKQYCLACHGQDRQEGGLRIDRLSRDLSGGADLRQWSDVLDMIDSGEMPPADASRQPMVEERQEVVAWFDANLSSASRKPLHWSFQPLVRPTGNSVDYFVQRGLEENGLQLGPIAEPRRLLRRTFLDLVGLPPSPAESASFAANPSQRRFEEIVDDLLGRLQYGERWGRHWLDLARYADSNGLHEDRDRPHAWRYRDYVIASFNQDKPYGQFICEQLAGDEIDPANPDAWVATGFCRNGPSNDENIAENELESYRLDQLDNMLATTAQVFLGQTIQCARCHNHKLEPFTLTDYYRLLAVFDSSVPAFMPLDEGTIGAPQFFQPQPRDRRRPPKEPHIRALTDLSATARVTHVLLRGNLDTPGARAEPGTPQVLESIRVPFQVQPTETTTGNRAALARWIASPENPLTWRVMANRIWHYHFGRGLIDTPSNLGASGSNPTHPELLDWLACELRDNGGRLKPLHKKIVLSRTYRQSSAYWAAASEIDPDARLLWRYPPHRLEAEAIRDSVLAASGKLNHAMGGPGIKPRVPAEILEQSKRNIWPKVSTESPEHWRRSVYVYVKRQLPMPLLSLFDAPETTESCAVRFASTTPTQGLALLNGQFVNEQARFMADDVLAGEERDQVQRIMERVWALQPSTSQLAVANRFFNERLQAHEIKRNSRREALVDLAVVLFNSSQFVYVD